MRCSDSYFDSFSLLHMFHAEDLTASLQKSSYVGEEDNVVDVNEAVGAVVPKMLIRLLVPSPD